MPRLHSDRSRSYPGRPARRAVQLSLDSIWHGNMPEDRAGVSRGHSSSPTVNEGPNPEQGKGPSSSTNAMNGGAISRRVDDKPEPDENLLEQILSRPNMMMAWERVKANKGAPGVDNIPIGSFMAFAREHWEKIRSAHHAVTQVRDFIRSGYRMAVDADLANILLDDLDKELEKRGHRFARYADDFVILVKSRRAGERVMANITRFLERNLKLAVNQEKSKVASTNEITFLGLVFKGTRIRWSDKAFAKFKQRVKELTGRSWGVSMGYRLAKLTEYLRGWMSYFGISEYYTPIPEIDHWLRRRIRMCYWKRWRYCRTKVRELTKLGTHLRTAISVGMSRKGPWRLSRTLATQTGMTNPWLKDQGLLSVKDLWVNIHYPATAR
jgi:hypothetical protein